MKNLLNTRKKIIIVCLLIAVVFWFMDSIFITLFNNQKFINALILTPPINNIIIRIMIIVLCVLFAFIFMGLNDRAEQKAGDTNISKLLYESQIRYKKLLDSANDAIIIANTETGIIEEANNKACDLFKTRLDTLLGQHFLELHPKEESAYYQKLFKRAGNGTQINYNNIYIVNSNGKKVPVEATTSMIEHRGKKLVQGIFRDITSRIEAEREIKEREEKFRALFMESPIPIAYFDEYGMIEDLNIMAKNIVFKKDVNEMRKYYNLFEDETIPSYVRDKVRKGEKVFFENKFSYNNNAYTLPEKNPEQIIYVDASIAPIKDLHGKNRTIGYIAQLQDITEKKIAEMRIIEERNKVRRYMDLAQVVFIVFDENVNIKMINKKGYQLLGYDTEEAVLGLNWIENFIPEELKEKETKVFKDFFSGEKELPEYSENRMITRDKEKKIIAWHNSPDNKNSEGKITSILCSGIDITEKIEAEQEIRIISKKREELESIVNLSPVVVFRWSAEKGWPVEFVTKNVSIFGYSQEDFYSGKLDYERIIHHEDIPKIKDTLKKHKKDTDNKYFAIEYRIIKADGSICWVDARKITRTDESGNVTHYIGLISDITQKKETENKIKASLIEKETLLKEIHHRVKNNLQVISSMLNLQILQTDDPFITKIFNENRNRVLTMAMVHETLYESESLSDINFKYYIQKLINGLFNSYKNGWGRIVLKSDIEDISLSIDVSISCGLMLNELVLNAFKHGFKDKKEGRIDICARKINNGKQFKLTVKDNGIGIDPNLDIEKTESLGLRLVYVLSRKYKCEINITSNNGTQIDIILNKF